MTTNDADIQPLLLELHSLAAAAFSGQAAGHTLQPTAVVNELWVRLLKSDGVRFDSETAFRAWAARAIRSVLIDHARRKSAEKRGGGRTAISLSLVQIAGEAEVPLTDLEDELALLESTHERSARVVEMRFFGGMTDQEIARVLGVTDRTVRNDWALARAWLRSRLIDQRDEH